MFLILAMLSILGMGEALAQETTFSKETFTDANMSLPYRKATIPGYGDNASLVIYLHGGTSKGNDNEKQMLEPYNIKRSQRYENNVDDYIFYIIIFLWLADTPAFSLHNRLQTPHICHGSADRESEHQGGRLGQQFLPDNSRC